MTFIATILEAIPKWVWVAIVAALSATSCKLHYANGQLEIEVSKAATKVAQVEGEKEKIKTDFALDLKRQSDEFSVASAASRKKEQDLQLAINSERKKTNEAVYALDSSAYAVGMRLSKKGWDQQRATLSAPEASSAGAVAGTPEVAGIGYQPSLPPEIGDLIDEAKRADTIRLELLSCYRSYDEARNKLKPTEGEVK